MNQTTDAALATRVTRLEEALRRAYWTIAALAVLVVFVGLILPMLRQEVAAERFVLTVAGAKRADLAASEDGLPTLSLYDSNERVRLAMLVNEDGVPLLFFADHMGDVRAVFGLPSDGIPAVVLRGAADSVHYMTPYGN